MKIPKLVPYIWVINFRNGIDDGMFFHFQEHRLMPTMVTTLQDIYLKIIIPENILMKCSMVVTDRPTYRKIKHNSREDVYRTDENVKQQKIQSLLVPCSEDDQNINYGIGVTNFEFGVGSFEPVFKVF
jgi:hypothetical protein